ncbi:MAG: hypothetical protein ACJ0PP_00790 [Flavobacteriaceae bacterium]
MRKFLFFLVVSLFFSCSEENGDQSPLLDRLNDIVWTRGTNFKIFKSNPFRLILVEDGVCLEFTENPKDIRGNEFQYTLLESGVDTLKLGYRVTGERLNHCGTFIYFLDNQGELIRNYEECNSIFDSANLTSFFKADRRLETLCPEIQ